MTDLARCPWVGEDPLLVDYHDQEWGVPVHDDRILFEFLVLESAQAGLSWTTILRKRDNYRQAFEGFEPARVARFGRAEVNRLLGDAGIVRNRAKIEAAVGNAKVMLELQDEFESLDAYLWSFVGGTPLQNRWRRLAELPAETAESRAMSRDLKLRGFRFFGPVIAYAHMQATGMVNDHLVSCYRHAELAGA